MITIKTDDDVRHFALTPDGWEGVLIQDQLIRHERGLVEFDNGSTCEWDKDDAAATLREAIVSEIEVLLCSKEFVEDRHACDDPYSVFHQIPETLRMRSMLGETPHSFVELVRWASHDVR